jgi:hypothetical protein
VQLVYPLVELLDEFALLLEVDLQFGFLRLGRYGRGGVFEVEEKGARMLNVLW